MCSRLWFDKSSYAGDDVAACISAERWQEDKNKAGKSEKDTADMKETQFFRETIQTSRIDQIGVVPMMMDAILLVTHLVPGEKEKRQNGFE
ncbi:hypothetical protein [Salibacterium qingdaonense]|uniref:hypothetical protein n=1 Tax=Salibacterium qingdaonense TaxID=266892 RepID=UPI000B865681|nr:hypothetical protein [Salibacterium qingdaonense]